MSARLLAPEPLVVALPGAGCALAQVLASPERCLELGVALACLSAGLDSP
jgi:chromate reductase, NAD(P)H dehydrogenase (quinone)